MDLTREEAAALLLLFDSAPKLKPERGPIHPINKLRHIYGEYVHLFPQLLADENKFFEYFRMSSETFYFILSKIEHRLTKNWANCHKQPIKPEERLVLTLRFLSTGTSFRGLAFSFRMGKSTVAEIVKETITAIWEELQPLYMPIPSEEDFKRIAKEFAELWNFPHVVGCLDGKHVRIKCPANSGSMNFNYKKYFSIILQGLVDANYKFITIDVGGYGKQSDGGTFLASHLYEFIESKDITFPEPKILPNTNVKAPFYMLADEAYPLLPHLMTPYKKKSLNERKRNFNHRLSRARKSVECAFGILYAKWRILSKEIETVVDVTDRIIKCICILQNIIIEREGIERHMIEVNVQENNSVMYQVQGRQQNRAKDIRDTLAMFMEKYPLVYIN